MLLLGLPALEPLLKLGNEPSPGRSLTAAPADIICLICASAGVSGTPVVVFAAEFEPGVPAATVEGLIAVMDGSDERVGFCGFVIFFKFCDAIDVLARSSEM
jgi:hypothetical protein